MEIASLLPRHLQLKVLGLLEDELFSAAAGSESGQDVASRPQGEAISQRYMKVGSRHTAMKTSFFTALMNVLMKKSWRGSGHYKG